MITYPRKFKRLKAVLPAAVPALLIPLLLNLLLIPDTSLNIITESAEVFMGAGQVSFSPRAVPVCVMCAVCAALTTLLFAARADAQHSAAVFCVPDIQRVYLPPGCRQLTARVFILLALIPVLLVIYLLSPVLSRTPLSSQAVVLIASAWQCVSWGLIARAFKSGIWGILAVLVIFGSVFVLPVPAAVLIGFAISCVICLAGRSTGNRVGEDGGANG